MFIDYSRADLGRCESASLGGGRRFANLAIGLEYDWFLGFGASALFTAHGRVLDLWCETSQLYSCTEFTNPLALRRRWRS